MKEYKLGPNGAILTSLNLFAAKHLMELVNEVETFCKSNKEEKE